METKSRMTKLVTYQNIGFLAVIMLGFLDEWLKLSSLIFGNEPFKWQFRQATLGMILVLAVWLLVNLSTRRILNRIQYLEKFLLICAWCHHINYKGHWISMEDFMQQGFDTPTTHGICPICLERQKASLRKK